MAKKPGTCECGFPVGEGFTKCRICNLAVSDPAARAVLILTRINWNLGRIAKALEANAK